MADPRFRVDAWIRSTLTGDATLMAMGSPALSVGSRVYHEDGLPQSATFPLITYKHYGGPGELRVVGTYRIWTEMVYLIKLIRDPTTPVATAESILSRVDALLDAVSATNTGGVIHWCLFDNPTPPYRDVTPGGQVYLHHPVLYRIAAKSTST